MTTTTTEMTDVALDRIVANPWQPRAGFDPEYIKELADSILAVGLLQEPLSRRAEGYFQLAFGHSRIEALKLLREREEWGPTVRLKVADLSDEDMAFIALTENQARKNLTPAEEISAWAKVLREIEGVTIQSLADRVGVDRTTMSKNLAILDLPRSVLDLVDSGAMSVRAAREFLALRNEQPLPRGPDCPGGAGRQRPLLQERAQFGGHGETPRLPGKDGAGVDSGLDPRLRPLR